MSETFRKLEDAYLIAEQRSPRLLASFFFNLAQITGNHGKNERFINVWTRNDDYPRDIHLAYVFFSYIARINLDLITTWHSVDGLTGHHLKDRSRITGVDIGEGPNYILTPERVNTFHPKLSAGDWAKLLAIVVRVAREDRISKSEEEARLKEYEEERRKRTGRY